MMDPREARALFRQMVEEARLGDAEAIQVVAERARLYRNDPAWAKTLAEAERVLGPLDKLDERRPIHRFEDEGTDRMAETVSTARIAGAMFIVAAVLAAAAFFFWR